MTGIVDYGMGNLGSVSNACRHLGIESRIVTQPREMDACAAVILPGVGAFGDCMAHLSEHGFISPLRAWIGEGRPFLGICLGLQVLFESSEEAPGVAGLGALKGAVRKFPGGPGFKVPQIGWNTVRQLRPECPLFRGVPDGAHFYLVHSYYVAPEDPGIVAGMTDYGVEYTSAVWNESLFAVQFHPEKSHNAGLRMLRNFADTATRILKTAG
ncbi:MAG: imidazole glycerol phosphate synthase subunit HisH [Kiritimatiellae bacterium]|nr:imidazole glycerol phosphate synthase subunit HisH [Kiritimatiellia bacterium]